ncbi:hypothetical protein [Aliihoeflea sp. PC F10.4]
MWIMTLTPLVKIRAVLGKEIPGDGTVYNSQSPDSPTIGECIYCGGRKGLSDEHTIPYALFGIAKLKKASCAECSAKTQKVEQRLLRNTFGQVREYLQFPSRKARRSNRWSGTRPVTDKRSGSVERQPLAEGVVALYLLFPDYWPRALSAEPADERHGKRSAAFIHLNDSGKPLPDHYEEGWIKFNSSDIERCIAKIALCEAIRVVDQSIRDPVLSRFILDGDGDSSDFLGALAKHDITDKMHHVFFQKLTKGGSDAVGLLTTVELFGFLPSPSYKVVIRPSEQVSHSHSHFHPKLAR